MKISEDEIGETDGLPRRDEGTPKPSSAGISSVKFEEEKKEKTSLEGDEDKNNAETMNSEQDWVKESSQKKNSITGEGEALTVLVTVPPDGGWGWVVVAASFVANFIVDGILYCYGDFLPVIKKDFNESATKVSVPGSLLAGFYLMTGPFVSILANKFGFQKVTIAGAIFASVAFALSSLATNIDTLIFTYGVLGGIGFGMIYSPSIVTVGYYFERWRGIATGIAVCGSGIGTFSFSPLNSFLIDQVGWQNTFLIQAGIILICIICGIMYRPIKPVKIAVNENFDENEEGQCEEPLKKSHDEQLKRSDSFLSVKSHKPPTAAEILHIAGRQTSFDTAASTRLSKSSQSLGLRTVSIKYVDHLEKADKRLSVPNVAHQFGLSSQHRPRKERSLSHAMDEGNQKGSSEISCHGVERAIRNRRSTIAHVDEKVKVALQRDDAFFSGSLLHLPQYKPEKDSISYTLSVTRIPPDPIPEEKKKSFFAQIWDSIVDLFDFSLLLSPSFDLFLLSGFLTMVGYFTPFSYIKDRVMEEGGWSDEDANWLLSTIGITNTLGRVLSGLMSGLPGMDATLITNVALLVAGIATALSGLVLSIPYQYAYCAVFGFATAAFASLRSIMVVDLLGLENLNNAFGILLFVQGFGSALGSPVAGTVREATSSYQASFCFSGALIVLSGLILFPLKAVKRWEKNRKIQNSSIKSKTERC